MRWLPARPVAVSSFLPAKDRFEILLVSVSNPVRATSMPHLHWPLVEENIRADNSLHPLVSTVTHAVPVLDATGLLHARSSRCPIMSAAIAFPAGLGCVPPKTTQVSLPASMRSATSRARKMGRHIVRLEHLFMRRHREWHLPSRNCSSIPGFTKCVTTMSIFGCALRPGG